MEKYIRDHYETGWGGVRPWKEKRNHIFFKGPSRHGRLKLDSGMAGKFLMSVNWILILTFEKVFSLMYRRRKLWTFYDFLIVQSKGLYGWGGGGQGDSVHLCTWAARAGRLSSFMHLLPYPPQYGPWKLPGGIFTSLVYIWLTYVYAHVGMLLCTHIMLVCTRRPFRGGLLYIKPPMHLWLIRPRA